MQMPSETCLCTVYDASPGTYSNIYRCVDVSVSVLVYVYMVILKPDLVQLCTFFALFAGNRHSAIFLSFFAKIDFLIAVPQGWPQTCAGLPPTWAELPSSWLDLAKR